jgi:hypothetical protein
VRAPFRPSRLRDTCARAMSWSWIAQRRILQQRVSSRASRATPTRASAIASGLLSSFGEGGRLLRPSSRGSSGTSFHDRCGICRAARVRGAQLRVGARLVLGRGVVRRATSPQRKHSRPRPRMLRVRESSARRRGFTSGSRRSASSAARGKSRRGCSTACRSTGRSARSADCSSAGARSRRSSSGAPSAREARATDPRS